MRKLILSVRHFLVLEDGPTMAEYALMVVLIAVVCLAGVSLLGTTLRDLYNQIAAGI